MTENRTWTLKQLADHIDARLEGDGECSINGLNTLQTAQSGELSFLANPAYRRYLADTQAAAVVLRENVADEYAGNKLIVDNPYLSYARLTALFDPAPRVTVGVHESAVVDPSAELASDVCIGANVTIGAGVIIGSGTQIGPGSQIGDHCQIGENSCLQANVTLYHGVSVGNRVTLHSGCVIGADGFGFAPSAEGWVKIHQVGGVVIGDDVEIGACTTVDRGALDDTVIGRGVIIDNQVQIAHNVQIGENTAIAGCTGIAGSTRIGRNCTIAGAVSIVGHLTIADGVHISVNTLVNKSISQAGSYSSGVVASPTKVWRRNAVRFGQLDQIAQRLSELERRVPPTDKDK
ncbi:MAG: UDP-3-O-(3-hydroxymyristoyl)glucosamine N-acyltransferase [Cellvibrionaceae bacterium]|nr:UDP-3-O-(3-hydroxymyristoyl)glucosamine N-acyltransferase [Cellvibrionaceae bacterium]|tara:strand:- start:7691 stop:8734 length:1044 start_codon:yes stop_codon:yes gene_type:complete